MAFYNPDPAMAQRLGELIGRLEEDGRPGLADTLSLTWLRYRHSLRNAAAGRSAAQFWDLPVQGASWQGARMRYPASVVKLVYLVAAEAWLQRQLLLDDAELRRALAAMIRDSGNDATGLIVDLLTATSSGPSLPRDRYEHWKARRQLVNDWLATLEWPELEGCNACQKTWGEGPYGRERDFYGPGMDNRNRLSTDATARLLHAVIGGEIISPPACERMRELLLRSLDPAVRAADPENQVDGFIGAGLPPEARLWSKAGWMSRARHDAAYVEMDEAAPFLLVIFSEGERAAADEELLPTITAELSRHPSG